MAWVCVEGEYERMKEDVYIVVAKSWSERVGEYGTAGARIALVKMKKRMQTWFIICVSPNSKLASG